DQPDGLPRKILYSAGTTVEVNPIQTTWENGTAFSRMSGLNKSIGHRQPVEDETPASTNSPWNINVTVSTNYRFYDEAQQRYRTRFGTGVTVYPTLDIFGKTVIPYPKAAFREPLGITVSLESFDGEFVRDGSETATIIADVTWRGNPITGKFTENEGTLDESIIDFPFPEVTFEAGTCFESNAGDAGQMKDTRNISSGCLVIGNNLSISLDSYASLVSLSRTDIKNLSGVTHTHEAQVNDSGNGTTTRTISLSGATTANHTHIIT
ncbi:unnamed protein product, partial [marine sediment metagenome]